MMVMQVTRTSRRTQASGQSKRAGKISTERTRVTEGHVQGNQTIHQYPAQKATLSSPETWELSHVRSAYVAFYPETCRA